MLCLVFLNIPREGTPAEAALERINHALDLKDQLAESLRQGLPTLMAHPFDTFGVTLSRLFKPWSLVQAVRFQAIAEPQPDPDSRITLSDEKDALGMNHVCVRWKLGPAVQRAFDRTIALLADEFRKNEIADETLDPTLESTDWPDHLQSTWHHMGTTRMHDSPQYGVVDRNCRVHSVNNLFIAGSSVFPTGGTNYPTMTIVALALRLADHLVDQLRHTPRIELHSSTAHQHPRSVPNVSASNDTDHIRL